MIEETSILKLIFILDPRVCVCLCIKMRQNGAKIVRYFMREQPKPELFISAYAVAVPGDEIR